MARTLSANGLHAGGTDVDRDGHARQLSRIGKVLRQQSQTHPGAGTSGTVRFPHRPAQSSPVPRPFAALARRHSWRSRWVRAADDRSRRLQRRQRHVRPAVGDQLLRGPRRSCGAAPGRTWSLGSAATSSRWCSPSSRASRWSRWPPGWWSCWGGRWTFWTRFESPQGLGIALTRRMEPMATCSCGTDLAMYAAKRTGPRSVCPVRASAQTHGPRGYRGMGFFLLFFNLQASRRRQVALICSALKVHRPSRRPARFKPRPTVRPLQPNAVRSPARLRGACPARASRPVPRVVRVFTSAIARCARPTGWLYRGRRPESARPGRALRSARPRRLRGPGRPERPVTAPRSDCARATWRPRLPVPATGPKPGSAPPIEASQSSTACTR